MRIITDSAADFTQAELRLHHIDCVPTQVILDGVTYTPGADLTEEMLWQKLLSGAVCKTSQPAPDRFLQVFEEAKSAGEEAVYVGISSALSGTLQSAMVAQAMAGHNGVHIVDSLTGAAAQKLLVLHACALRDQGHTGAEIAAALEKLLPHVRLYASLDTLDSLVRSGRIPKAAGGLGVLTHLKPLLHVTRDGLIALCGTAFGRARALDSLAKRIAGTSIDPRFPVIPFYSYDPKNCQSLIKKLTAQGIPVQEELLSAIGPAIAGHIGPSAYGVAFVESK